MRGIIEKGGPRRDDSRREPSDPPVGEPLVVQGRGWRATVPAVVVAALISALATWAAKPQTAVALSPEDRAALQKCSETAVKVDALSQQVGELRVTVKWIEPQIGVLLVRTEPRSH